MGLTSIAKGELNIALQSCMLSIPEGVSKCVGCKRRRWSGVDAFIEQNTVHWHRW